MYNFENYTVVVYETSKDYFSEVPGSRFVAHLREIAEATLHEYGPTQEKAIANLREQFEKFTQDAEKKVYLFPRPENHDEEQFSGKIVLRMPPWLHKTIDGLADQEGSSTNSYIVNRLIRTVTIEETVAKVNKEQERLFRQLRYEVKMRSSKIKVSKTTTPTLTLYKENSYSYKKVV